MDKNLFDDLIVSCEEIIEYKKGNIQLKTTTLELPDEDIEKNQLFYDNFNKLPESSKEKAIRYVNELLQTSTG